MRKAILLQNKILFSYQVTVLLLKFFSFGASLFGGRKDALRTLVLRIACETADQLLGAIAPIQICATPPSDRLFELFELSIQWTINSVSGTLPTAFGTLQICAMPPSTKSSMPLTKLLSSDARKTTALAISSGVPTRPRGILSA